jgi:hypothetical protein
MTTVREQAPRTPPRFVVRTFWLLHRAAYRLTGGGFGLCRPVAGEERDRLIDERERAVGELV